MTDTTMARESGAALGFGAAFVRQFRLLWTSRRPLLLLVAVLALLILAGDPWVQEDLPRLLLFWPLWLTVVGPVWGFAVFYNEGPSQRLYHWSLPVGRTPHTLARLTAGLAWLWIVMAALILTGALMAAADGDFDYLARIGAAGWVNLFTGPLIGYLGVSVLTVASDYPLRWFFGILFLVPLTLSVLAEWLRADDFVEWLVQPVISEEWGLLATIAGGLGEEVMTLQRELLGFEPGQGPSMHVEYWWIATAGWVLLGVIVLVAFASRHPDRLPRLRRSG